MKKTKNAYSFLSNYCLRTPLLSLDTILNHTKEKVIEDSYLEKQWKNESLKEAVFLASPYFFGELELLFNDKIKDVKKQEKLKQSFLKYVIRASSRCTPFGLFAGVSLGEFDDTTNIKLKPLEELKRQTHLDMNYIVALSDYLANKPVIKKQLLFYPNTSLYKIADQYRYIEYKLKKTKREYSVEGVMYSPYIESVLKAAEEGKTIFELMHVIDEDDITNEEVIIFIESLINNQILVSELAPSVTGENMFLEIIKTISKLKECDLYVNQLIKLQKAILELDLCLINEKKKYEKCYAILDEIGCCYNVKYVFQTNIFTKLDDNKLQRKIGYKLRNAIPLLNILNQNKENNNLRQFKKKFLERYEGRKIPLVQALDIEIGIGYIQNEIISDTVPFLNDIKPRGSKSSLYNQPPLTSSEIILQKLLYKAFINGDYIIELKDTFFKDEAFCLENNSDTLSALIEVITLDEEEFICLNSFGGSSGANLIARFCEGDDELLKHITEITTLEQQMNKDKVLAEIVHLPEARVGNVIKRPHIRSFELPYLGKSNLPLEEQIAINDILVYLKKGELVLWSKKLDKEILPRLTNAHNYAKKSLPIYHFLCDLQSQNTQKSLSFSWESLAVNQTFLPRVCHKKIILSKAKWILSVADIQPILNLYNKTDELLKEVSLWRKNLQMPKLIQLREGDNTLLINLENVTMIKLLLSSIKSKEQFVLEEFLFNEKSLVKNKRKENTANQFVISFYNETKLKAAILNEE